MYRLRFAALVVFAVLLAAPGMSWAGVIVIDDFNDSNYSDDGLIFNNRTLAYDAGTSASIGGGALGVLDFTSDSDGWVSLTYSVNDDDGISMSETGGFELEGVFLGPTGQTLTWNWEAKDKNNNVLATASDTWTVDDDPLFMDPDPAGTYSGWKTLVFRFDWSFDAGAIGISASRLTAVPEPSSLALLGVGAVGLICVGARRRRRSKQ